MALYRNIAGFIDEGQQLGLTLLIPPTAVLQNTSGTLLPGPGGFPFPNPADIAAAKAAKYDYLLSHSLDELTAAGYYVTTDNGSVFQWTDAAHNTSTAYLPLQDIQEIENSRGTAGALLLHLQQPAIAKDTAGYAGGGSSTGGSVTQYSDPIPDVQDLPPVKTNQNGEAVFEYTGPSTAIPGGSTTTPTKTTTAPAAAVKNNIAPLVALGGLVAVALAGDRLAGRRTNVLFVGGIGAFFYFMAKRTK